MKRLLLISVAALVLGSLPATADTFSTFDVNVLDTRGQVTGTVVLDETTGTFTESDLTSVLGRKIDKLDIVYFGYNAYPKKALEVSFAYDDFAGDEADPMVLDTFLPLNTLIGYHGSSLCVETATCDGYFSTISVCYYRIGCDGGPVISGAFTEVPEATATPEPGSLLLLGTGLLSSLDMIRRRALIERQRGCASPGTRACAPSGGGRRTPRDFRASRTPVVEQVN